MDFSALPKVELHLHLDCSLSYAAVSALDSSVTLETYQQDYQGPEKIADLADFFPACAHRHCFDADRGAIAPRHV